MKRVHRHEVDGEIAAVPLRWNKQLQQETEDDEGYLGQPAYTPAGRPILLTIEDACPHADMGDSPGGIDCGACRHYHQFPGSQLGVCSNEKRRRPGRQRGAAGTRKEEPI